MSEGLVTVSYIASTILFILSLGGLSNPETSRRGNAYGVAGMAIAFFVQLRQQQQTWGVEASDRAKTLAGDELIAQPGIIDTRSLIIHPASTTHRQLAEDARKAAGAGDDVVRLSVGLETADDLIRDLDRALSRI